MTPTKLLIGQILVVFAIVIFGVWAATQWAAAMLGYQAQLGAPWIIVFDIPVYRPWQLFRWWYHYEAYAPEVFDKAGALAGASGFLGCASAVAGSLWRARQKAYRQTMRVQAQVVENVQADASLLGELVSQSQSATGSLQAQQATNQLIALSTKQQLQIQNMMAAQYRADAIERARQAQATEAAREKTRRFIGSADIYTRQ